jgi:hypothetical protein
MGELSAKALSPPHKCGGFGQSTASELTTKLNSVCPREALFRFPPPHRIFVSKLVRSFVTKVTTNFTWQRPKILSRLAKTSHSSPLQ